MTDDLRYPLHWPDGWDRTPPHLRERAQFKVSFAVARNHLLKELRLFEAENIIISTNVVLKKDGLPYANQKDPDDVGVAAYFTLNGSDLVYPCDAWDTVKANIRAIGRHIESWRGQRRWKVGSLERSYQGHKVELLTSGEPNWWDVLKVSEFADSATIEAAYRARARVVHPDQGGDAADMALLNLAIKHARKACAVRS